MLKTLEPKTRRRALEHSICCAPGPDDTAFDDVGNAIAGAPTICILREGHSGPHNFVPNERIAAAFPS